MVSQLAGATDGPPLRGSSSAAKAAKPASMSRGCPDSADDLQRDDLNLRDILVGFDEDSLLGDYSDSGF